MTFTLETVPNFSLQFEVTFNNSPSECQYPDVLAQLSPWSASRRWTSQAKRTSDRLKDQSEAKKF